MGFPNSTCVRFQDDLEENGNVTYKTKYERPQRRNYWKGMEVFERTRKSLKAKVLSRVFSEDYEKVKHNLIFDPEGQTISQWSKIYLVASLVSVFVDPLFFFLPIVREEGCIDNGSWTLATILTIIRTMADVFYMLQIFVRFRTAYVAPSSRVFGRGEFVIDTSRIASRYLRGGFWLDLIVALPVPQVLTLVIIPNLNISAVTNTNNILRVIIFFQYLPRIYLIFPLTSKIVEATGIVTETAWAGAAYNLLLFMLASHVSGACWYLLSVERQEACWRSACNLEKPICEQGFFDCHWIKNYRRAHWFKSSNVTNICHPDNTFYQYGIYGESVINNITSSAFFNKYFYSLWWGLKNLSSTGQSLTTSSYVGEILFTIVIATLGLILFGLLIGNMQRYLESITNQVEEWRIKRSDTEQWMHHRQLPPELKISIRKYNQYKWVATRGVDEAAILRGLPMDLHREIKRHLCLSLVKRVPLFDKMDETMLDCICERLKPVLGTKDMFLMREGHPVNQMFFIIRGHLESYTTNGGCTEFFNSCRTGPGDFCGEELLTWALDLRPSVILPSSTRSVKAITEVEAFTLLAEDLKFVALQFKRLHTRQFRQTFRHYSYQWRTWAACFIQAAWRRHKKLKEAAKSRTGEDGTLSVGTFWDKYAESLIANTKCGSSKESPRTYDVVENSLEKPAEPDFEE